MREGTDTTALEEIMAGKGIALIEGHQARCIAGAGLVQIMADLIVLFVMVHHMTDTIVQIMEGIAGKKKLSFFLFGF